MAAPNPTDLALRVELETKINDLASRRSTLSEEEIQNLTIYENALQRVIEKITNSVELQQKRIESIQREKEILIELYELMSKKTKSEEEAKNIKIKELEIQEMQAKLEKEMADRKQAGNEMSAFEIAQKQLLIQKEEHQLELSRERKKLTDNMADSLAGKLNLKVEKGSIYDFITNEDGSLNTQELTKNYESFATKFEQQFLNIKNVTAAITQQIVKSTVESVTVLDNQSASLRRATGAIDGYTTELNMAANFAGMNNVSMEKTGEAMLSLANNFSEFTNVSSQARVEMAATIGTLSNLGVSSDVASKNMSTLIQSFGMSSSQAIETSKQLAVLANTLGTSPQKIASDFAGAASTLVVYGEKGIDVFRGLEAAAKASGLEVSTLVGIVKKMDTFQGAAEAAGKLNAVLGGGLLNSSQLLVATEEERIKLVVESVQSQGVQFKDMDKYTQMSIANAAGITDMAQANKLFGMSLSEYDKYVTQTEKSKDATEKFSQMSAAATTMTDKFKVAMMQLATFATPILFILSALVDGFASGIAIINKLIAVVYMLGGAFPTPVVKAFGAVIDYLSNGLKFFIQIIGFVIGALVAIKAATIAAAIAQNIFNASIFYIIGGLLILAAVFGLLKIGFDYVVGGFQKLWQMLHLAGSPMLYMLPEYIAKGFNFLKDNILFFLGPIGLAIKAFQYLYDIFHSGGSSPLYEIPNYFGKAFNYLKENILLIIGPIGWVVMGLKSLYDMFHKTGSGPLWHIAVDMAEAFEVLANVFSTIPSIMDRIAESMGKMAASTFKLFYAISGLAGTLPLFALGLVAAVPAMLAFAGASFVMNVTGGNYLEKILSAITPQRSAGLKVVVDSLDGLNKIHKEIKPEGLKNVKELVDEVERYNFQLLASSALNIVSPLESLIKAVGSLGESKETKGGDLILKVDGREIGRIAISAINASGGGNVIVKNTTAAGTRG